MSCTLLSYDVSTCDFQISLLFVLRCFLLLYNILNVTFSWNFNKLTGLEIDDIRSRYTRYTYITSKGIKYQYISFSPFPLKSIHWVLSFTLTENETSLKQESNQATLLLQYPKKTSKRYATACFCRSLRNTHKRE